MNRRLAIALGLLVALGGAQAVAQFGQQAAKLDLVKVKDDLYVIQNELVPGNTTALITSEGVVLVDDKFEIDHENVMAQLRKVTNQPVRYVINSHYHGDHSGGNAKLQALGAQVVSSEKARQRLVAGKQTGPANITFDDHARLYLGGKRVEMYYLGRGHTDGDIVALFPDHRVLAAGDLFTIGEGLPALVDGAGGGSVVEWPRTIEKVLQLQFDQVVPGHGVVTTKAEMAKYRDSLTAMGRRVRDMQSKKASRAEVEKVLRSEYGWQDFHIQMALDAVIKELQP